MSFWQANTKLAIGQKSVSIPAEVQGEYGENGKITIKIDPSTEFFQPTESYLSFRLKLKLGSADNAMRLQLNPDIGAHSLLRDVRIMSGTGVVLEESIAYNVQVQQMYAYDSNDNIRRKRALTEGTTLHQPLNRSTTGAARSNRNATVKKTKSSKFFFFFSFTIGSRERGAARAAGFRRPAAKRPALVAL